MNKENKHIVVIGGGAGGLELIARLSQQFKKNKSIRLTLIDRQLKHIWKPLLHQVAAGTYFNYQDEIDYFTYAYQKKFTFIYGLVQCIERNKKIISLRCLSPLNDNTETTIIQIEYDLLIISTGGQSNDFNIAGVKEHCFLLDNIDQAERLNKLLMKYLIQMAQPVEKQNAVKIAIVGGGATGIELAAELNHVLQKVTQYGYKKNKTSFFKVTVIETAHRILNTLPPRVSQVIMKYLSQNHIHVSTETQITKVSSQGLFAADGTWIEADIIIWAAGVKANLLPGLDDLEINKLDQLVVTSQLQTTRDASIFALGDCASCKQIERSGKIYFVPPRAQAAHQQAKLLAKSLKNFLLEKPLLEYRYKDYGSLITLSRYNVVGNIMTNVAKNFYIEGALARFAYWLLFKKHLFIVKGLKYAVLSFIGDYILEKQKPEIKLH